MEDYVDFDVPSNYRIDIRFFFDYTHTRANKSIHEHQNDEYHCSSIIGIKILARTI